MSNIIIGVISHKEYNMPNDPIYLPVEVGASNRDKHFFSFRDDIGENISTKNASYCELTGYYAVYKNLNYDILGFVHYRRLFISPKNKNKRKPELLKKEEIEAYLSKYDFILPKKRNYYIETNYKHYIRAHKKEALDKLSEIIKNDYPAYYESFIKQMNKKTCHLFNMFIAKKENANAYLDFIFEVLGKLEKKINLDDYKGYDKRVFGFLAERLLDVYIDTNKLTFIELPYYFTEKQNIFKKIIKCLFRIINKNHDTSKQ